MSKHCPLQKFKIADKKIQFKYRSDKEKITEQLGYQFITQAVVSEYRKHKSADKVGELFQMSGSNILIILKKMGEPLQKKGGYRGPEQRSPKNFWHVPHDYRKK